MIHGIAKINEIPMLNSILIFIISFTLYQSLFPTYWENKAVPIIVVETIIPISISVYAFAYDNAWLPPVMLIDIKLSTKEFKAKRNTENTTGKAVIVKDFQTCLFSGKFLFNLLNNVFILMSLKI